MISCATFAQNITKQGKTFIATVDTTVTTRTKSEPINTGYTYKDKDKKDYPIFMGKSGACYIIKTSKKSGKDYKQYLGEEISTQICKEIGTEYKPKKNKK